MSGFIVFDTCSQTLPLVVPVKAKEVETTFRDLCGQHSTLFQIIPRPPDFTTQLLLVFCTFLRPTHRGFVLVRLLVCFEVLQKLRHHFCRIAGRTTNERQLDQFAQQKFAARNLEAVRAETWDKDINKDISRGNPKGRLRLKRAKGRSGSKNDGAVRALRMEFSMVENLSGLQEGIFSLSKAAQEELSQAVQLWLWQ